MRTAIFVALLTTGLLCAQAKAVAISDSGTTAGTYNSLMRTKTMSTKGFQNTFSIPVGSIIAWTGSANITQDDFFKYLECNGQTFDRNQYPELYAVLKTNRVPNLNNQFLRSTTTASQVLKTYEDTLASHIADVDDHTHEWAGHLLSGAVSGNLDSPDLSGNVDNTKLTGHVENGRAEETLSSGYKADIQSVTATSREQAAGFTGTAMGQGYELVTAEPKEQTIGPGGGGVPVTSVQTFSSTATLPPSEITGSATATFVTDIPSTTFSGQVDDPRTASRLVDDHVSGNLNSTEIKGDITNPHVTSTTATRQVNGRVFEKTGLLARYEGTVNPYSGRDETAPAHTFVRYFIKAIP